MANWPIFPKFENTENHRDLSCLADFLQRRHSPYAALNTPL